ncbi:uncharacterized protein LOC134201700 [Bombyx mori]|uniref:uncharacterized protein LOC134201700 n=1 Tax=Bombyx mori TaxID=7091 RepID=UPI002ED04A98
MTNEQMELLFSKFDAKLDEKLNQQTQTLTTAVTKNVMEAIDEKMKILMEENQELKSEVSRLKRKINTLEKEKRKSNLIFFGVDENGKRETELVDYIKGIIEEAKVHIDSHEINNIYRIGAQTSENRPVVVTFSTMWKKHLILKSKSNLPTGIYVKEDFPKDVLEARKKLQPKVEEEWKKGNIAFMRGDQLVIKKQKDNQREKRKRDKTISPEFQTMKKPNTHNETGNKTNKAKTIGQKEILKPNILQYMGRDRTTSTSTSGNSKN